MASTDPTPDLLPGVPALTLQRVSAVLIYIGIPGYLLLILSAFTTGRHRSQLSSLTVIGLCWIVASFVAVLVVIFLFNGRMKAETKAGYTTTWRGRSTLPQLDPRTGEVIRKAGDPFIDRSERLKGRSIPLVGTNSPVVTRRPSPWTGLRSLWAAIPGVAIADVVVFINAGGWTAANIIWMVVAFIAFLALVGLFCLGLGSVAKKRLATVQASAPGALVFVFSKSPSLNRAVKDDQEALEALKFATLGGVRSDVLAASADQGGLTIWHGNPPESALVVPWTVVTSAQADSMPSGNSSRPGILITFTSSDGKLVALPLANANPDPFPVASKQGVAWLVDQLEQLRTGKSSARLI